MRKKHLPGQTVTSISAQKKTQWHPPFCASMQLELKEYKSILEYSMEYALSTKPLLIDLLIIKKAQEVQIENEIGRKFRSHNIIEYKSPDDRLSIDNYLKTTGYTHLYLSIVNKNKKKDEAIKSFDITVTIVRVRKPKKLFRMLREVYNLSVTKRANGIYEVKDTFLGCVQIIVTKELDPKEHVWLTSLADGMKEDEARLLIEEAGKLSAPDDREYAESILQLAMEKNKDIFEKVKGCEDMCQAFWELYAPEIEAEKRASEKRGEQRGEKRGIAIGEKNGEKRGERRTLISLIIKKIQRGKDILSIADAVEEPVEMIRPIYEAVLAMPDADVGEIYEKVYTKGGEIVLQSRKSKWHN